jgi:hypothetical protein
LKPFINVVRLIILPCSFVKQKMGQVRPVPSALGKKHLLAISTVEANERFWRIARTAIRHRSGLSGDGSPFGSGYRNRDWISPLEGAEQAIEHPFSNITAETR